MNLLTVIIQDLFIQLKQQITVTIFQEYLEILCELKMIQLFLKHRVIMTPI